MRKRLISVCIIIILSGCVYVCVQKDENMDGQCSLEKIGEDQYEITLYDKAHNEVYSQVYSDMRVPPWVEMITDAVWEIGISVGSPARYTFYFNAETAEISDTYFNAVLFGDKYIAYMEDDVIGTDTITLTLTDIFKEGILHQEIVRDFSILADPMSAIRSVEMIDDKMIRLEYYEGEEMTVVSETVALELNSANPLLLLKNGNVKQITGFEFGDKFDYNIFNITGYDSDGYMYRLRDAEDLNLLFYFHGAGNRFSEIEAHDTDFCGIKIGENTMESIIPVLGEPDEYEEDSNGEGQTAIYYFEKGVFKLHIDRYDKINYVRYIAAERIADGGVTDDEPTEYETALQDDFDYAETIYYWNTSQDRAFIHPLDDDYNESRIPQIIEDYLTEHGTYKEEPDGVAYIRDEDYYVEYYVVGNRYSFIYHEWSNYWIDYEAGISAHSYAVYCATVALDEENKAGNLIYTHDTEHEIMQEDLYDAWGMKMCGISYEYLPDVPFPFITEYWNLDTGYDLIRDALCREHKTWFYKELAEFNEDGDVVGSGAYNENGVRSDRKLFFPNACIWIYDEEGRLEAIQEELQEYDIEREWGWWDDEIDYSGQIKFAYQDNGQISSAEYMRSSYTHGTYDSDGTIYYDEKGRMIYNEHYVTHGGDAHIYLYEEDSDKPWACLDWCSFVPGFESIYIYERE